MNYIIGIAGHPGSGKTLLAQSLHTMFEGSACIDMDHYQFFTEIPIEEVMKQWAEEGYDYSNFDIPKLPELLASFKDDSRYDNNIALFETHFGRRHPETGQYIDFLIWVDTPMDLAFARTILRFCHHLPQDNSQQSLHKLQEEAIWLESYTANYHNYIHQLLNVQLEEIKPGADVIVDGRLSPEEMTAQATRQVKKFLEDMRSRP